MLDMSERNAIVFFEFLFHIFLQIRVRLELFDCFLCVENIDSPIDSSFS